MLFKNLIQQESWRRVLIFHLVLQFKGIRRFCRVLTTAKAVMRLVFSLLGARVFAAWAVRLQPRSRQHPWTLIKPISCALNQAPFWQWLVQIPKLTPSIIWILVQSNPDSNQYNLIKLFLQRRDNTQNWVQLFRQLSFTEWWLGDTCLSRTSAVRAFQWAEWAESSVYKWPLLLSSMLLCNSPQ